MNTYYFPLGREFTVLSDHEVLEALKDKGFIKTSRITRWHERFQRFDLKNSI